MPPKKGSNQNKVGSAKEDKVKSISSKEESTEAKASENELKERSGTPSSSKKRKAQDGTGKEPPKASRRSARGAPSQSIDVVKLINFLLSPDSLQLCTPKDEFSEIEKNPQLRTYSTNPFTPFEELVSALILSRPISHILGVRSIRTIFNDPHKLNTPQAIRAKGKDGCRAALDEARTQHRQKTAEELVLLANTVCDEFNEADQDQSLEKFRSKCEQNAEREREMLKKNVKGLAKTGIDIFARRIQGQWAEWYPFADERSMKAVEMLGLPGDIDGLVQTIDEHWDQIKKDEMLGEKIEEVKRNVFVMVLERSVAAGLEGNVDQVRKVVA